MKLALVQLVVSKYTCMLKMRHSFEFITMLAGEGKSYSGTVAVKSAFMISRS